MSKQKVYVVRHYGYDYHEFESFLGLATAKEVAEKIARNNEHVYGEPIITYDFAEHMQLAKSQGFHVYIKLEELQDV